MSCSLAWSLPRNFPFFPPLLDISWSAIFRASPRKTWRNWITQATTIRETFAREKERKEKRGGAKLLFFNDRSNSIFGLYYWRTFRQRRSKVNWVTIAPLSSLEFHSRIWKRAEALKRSRNFLVPPWKLTFPPCYLQSYLHFDSKLSFRDLICVQCDKDFVSLLVEIDDYQFLMVNF